MPVVHPLLLPFELHLICKVIDCSCTFQYYSAQLDFMNDFVGVDVDAATKHKIKVARIPGSATGNSTSCAEMAIYLMLGLLRKQVGFNLLCYNSKRASFSLKFALGFNLLDAIA